MAVHGSLLRDSAAQHNSSTRTLRVAKCSLCDLERPIGLMVPDGGDACADLRWYCKDAGSCTQRWIGRRPGREFALDHGDQVRAGAQPPQDLGRDAEPPGGLGYHGPQHVQRLG